MQAFVSHHIISVTRYSQNDVPLKVVSSFQVLPSTCLFARKRRLKRKQLTEEESSDDLGLSEDGKNTEIQSKAQAEIEGRDDIQEEDDDDDDDYEDIEDQGIEEIFSETPRGDVAVPLVVRDIRTVVGRSSAAAATELGVAKSSPSFSLDNIRPSSADLSSSAARRNNADSFGNRGDELEQLLADAKAMKFDEKTKDNDRNNGLSIPSAVRNLISTIVTIDFFVVCAFLLWFLAGIFSSSVLRDDSIQIAFNGIFEPVVQPALGILMISAVLSAVFKEEED